MSKENLNLRISKISDDDYRYESLLHIKLSNRFLTFSDLQFPHKITNELQWVLEQLTEFATAQSHSPEMILKEIEEIVRQFSVDEDVQNLISKNEPVLLDTGKCSELSRFISKMSDDFGSCLLLVFCFHKLKIYQHLQSVLI